MDLFVLAMVESTIAITHTLELKSIQWAPEREAGHSRMEM